MNPFQKNPFKTNTNTRIIGYNKQFDEKQKISDIKENMMKLKFQKPLEKNTKEQTKPLSFKEKIDILKNINRK